MTTITPGMDMSTGSTAIDCY